LCELLSKQRTPEKSNVLKNYHIRYLGTSFFCSGSASFADGNVKSFSKDILSESEQVKIK
jgi:hypothetical protein